ncbi:C2H2 finger domain protein (Kin17), putative [Trichophyton benhamiae CBS 112371]|uniref:C2H2 finger domain protein (Kin17), putative n=1 Tax=Arthroderma benhamiae (strain ATCC MYA-4681 / CBS 112371) TaxID=663331 RepID=D4AUH0_ARTBC|nr:C2H2 finger domain protein (Kin17), putative [Trichophyton benhamiae CBS 112371]EFE33135.1 C2H2 finger domain protein (Kin17), putative [Trichophyton benhamiae CBS 112371]
MQIVAENPKKFIEGYSKEFQHDFLQLLRTSHGEKPIHLNRFYQEYISDKTHVHLNSTKWSSLTEFSKYLAREGICRVEEKEDGIFVQWIDNSPEAIRRRDLVQRANRLEEQQASEEKEILQQVERARQNKALSPEPEKPAELAKEKWTDFSLNLKSSSNSPKPTISASQGKNNEQQDPSKSVDKPVKKPNVFGMKRKQPSGIKAVPEPPKKMTEIERIMKEDMERKKRRLVK